MIKEKANLLDENRAVMLKWYQDIQAISGYSSHIDKLSTTIEPEQSNNAGLAQFFFCQIKRFLSGPSVDVSNKSGMCGTNS